MSTHIETVRVPVIGHADDPAVRRTFRQELSDLAKPLLFLIGVIVLISAIGTAVVMSALRFAS